MTIIKLRKERMEFIKKQSNDIQKLFEIDLAYYYLYIRFLTTFAITKAENSQLSMSEAEGIFHYNYRNDDYLTNRFKENIQEEYEFLVKEWVSILQPENRERFINLHDQLEYNNIVRWIRYADEIIKKQWEDIKKNGITKELIINIHKILSQDLDDMFLWKWIPHYSAYYSWEIRLLDNVFVWEHPVWLASNIENRISEIIELSKNIKDIFDVYYLHGIMYNTHIFCNGNKRTSRLIEYILLSVHGFKWNLPTTFWNYIVNNFYINKLVSNCIINEEYEKWSEASYHFTLISALYMKELLIQVILKEWFQKKMDVEMFHCWFPEKETFSIEEMVREICRKTWLDKENATIISENTIRQCLENKVLKKVENFNNDIFYSFTISDENEEYRNLVSDYEELFFIALQYDDTFCYTNTHFLINKKLTDLVMK